MPVTALNPAQRAAVTCTAPRILLKAAPGSGKTRVLARRAVRLLAEGYDPGELVLVTFTRAAAAEMRGRILEQLSGAARGAAARRLTVATFHALGAQWLREYHDRIGLRRTFTIRDEHDRRDLVRYAGRDMGHCPWPGQPKLSGQVTSVRALWRRPGVPERYAELLRQANALDFDGLMHHLGLLIHEAGPELRRRYPHVLVDEGQDTSPQQQALLDQLNPDHLFIVGDYAQAIYGFRGADPQGFVALGERDDWTVLELPTNYRSRPTLVAAATRLGAAMSPPGLQQDAGRAGQLQDIDEALVNLELSDERALLAAVAEAVADQVHSTGSSWSSCAVLSPLWAPLEALSKHLTDWSVRHRLTRRTPDPLATEEARWTITLLRAAVNPHDHLALLEALNAFQVRAPQGVWASLRATALREGLDILAVLLRDAAVDTAGTWRLAEGVLRALAVVRARWLEESEAKEEAKVAVSYAWEHAPLLVAELLDVELHLHTRSASARDLLVELTVAADALADSGTRPTTTALLDWYTTRQLDGDVADEALDDEVVLTSIHGAKGLEWDSIWVLGCEVGQLPRARSPEGVEEARRLLYVALTRARDRAVLCRTSAAPASPFLAELSASTATSKMEAP